MGFDLVGKPNQPPGSDPPPSGDDVAEIHARGAAELELARLRGRTTLTLGMLGLVGCGAACLTILAALGIAPVSEATIVLSNLITAGLAFVAGRNGHGKVSP